MKVTVPIRNEATGEVRLHVEEMWEDEEVWEFHWTENNAACDCQRAQYFAAAAGEPEPEHIPCSGHLFTALTAVLEDGREIPLDW